MAPLTNLDLVNKKIKKTVRIISFKDSDTSCTPLYQNLNILPLHKSIELRQAQYMWKLHNGFLPSSLSTNFTPNQRNLYSVSTSRLDSLSRYILYSGPITWNQIPHEIKTKPSLRSFTKNLRKHLFNQL